MSPILAPASVQGMQPLFVNADQLAALLNVSIQTLTKWRSDDKSPRFPQPVNVRGMKMFVVSEIEGFVRECIAERSAK